MAIDRVKCTECDNMILPQTADANNGLCARCAQVPPEIRRDSQRYRSGVASGAVFTPTEQELASARTPTELGMPGTRWELEPEYYGEHETSSVEEAITQAAGETDGHVFLVSASGKRLNLSFSRAYAVCEYQSEDGMESLYAYTDQNLQSQVPAELHVVQGCPCCGVGVFWYPSRFHLPRDTAFGLVRALTSSQVLSGVAWLDGGDISHTSCGEG